MIWRCWLALSLLCTFARADQVERNKQFRTPQSKHPNKTIWPLPPIVVLLYSIVQFVVDAIEIRSAAVESGSTLISPLADPQVGGLCLFLFVLSAFLCNISFALYTEIELTCKNKNIFKKHSATLRRWCTPRLRARYQSARSATSCRQTLVCSIHFFLVYEIEAL